MKSIRLKPRWAAIPAFLLFACTSALALDAGELPAPLLPATVGSIPTNVAEEGARVSIEGGRVRMDLQPTSGNSSSRSTKRYQEYMDSVIDNPYFVGAHWFQYIDSPAASRVRTEFRTIRTSIR